MKYVLIITLAAIIVIMLTGYNSGYRICRPTTETSVITTWPAEKPEGLPIDYRAQEIRSLDMRIKKDVEWLQSNEWVDRPDAGLLLRLHLDTLKWAMEKLAKYTGRNINDIAEEYNVIFPSARGEK